MPEAKKLTDSDVHCDFCGSDRRCDPGCPRTEDEDGRWSPSQTVGFWKDQSPAGYFEERQQPVYGGDIKIHTDGVSRHLADVDEAVDFIMEQIRD